MKINTKFKKLILMGVLVSMFVSNVSSYAMSNESVNSNRSSLTISDDKNIITETGTTPNVIYINGNATNIDENYRFVYNKKTKTLLIDTNDWIKGDGEHHRQKAFFNFVKKLVKNNDLDLNSDWNIDFGNKKIEFDSVLNNITEDELFNTSDDMLGAKLIYTKADSLFSAIFSSLTGTLDSSSRYDINERSVLVENKLNEFVENSKKNVLRNVRFINYDNLNFGFYVNFVGFNHLDANLVKKVCPFGGFLKFINCNIEGDYVHGGPSDYNGEFVNYAMYYNNMFYKCHVKSYDFSTQTIYNINSRFINEDKSKKQEFENDVKATGYIDKNKYKDDLRLFHWVDIENLNKIPIYLSTSTRDGEVAMLKEMWKDYALNPNSNSIRRRVVDTDDYIDIKGKGFFLSQNTFSFKDGDYVIANNESGDILGKFKGSNLLGVKELLEKHGTEVLHIYKPVEKVEDTNTPNNTPTTNNETNTNNNNASTNTTTNIINNLFEPVNVVKPQVEKKDNDKDKVKDKELSQFVGNDRVDTNIKTLEGNTSDTAIIVNSEKFADALSSINIMNKKDTKLILVNENRSDTNEILKKLLTGVNDVYILGSDHSVSKNLENYVSKDLNKDVKRLGGRDRYETNQKVLDNFKYTKYGVASGENFADGLSASALLKEKNLGLLLSNGSISPSYRDKIEYTFGGKNSLKNPEGIILAGRDRYDTNKKIIAENNKNGKSNTGIIATGEKFPDALSAVNLLSNKNKSDIYLSNHDINLKTLEYKNIFVVGGEIKVID